MKRVLLYIIGKSSDLVEQPLFNFASISVIVASVGVLFAYSLTHISLGAEKIFLQTNFILLQLIALETVIRLITSKKSRYLQSGAFFIDLITLIPLGLELIPYLGAIERITGMTLHINANQPGFILFQGIRSLRLLPSTIYFHRQRQLATFGLEKFSPLKLIIFSRITIITSFLILFSGLAVSLNYGNSLNAQKLHREQQILIQARSHGVLQTRLIFEKHVLGAYITQTGIRKFIPGTLGEIKNITQNFKYNRDYKQFDELQPGQSIIISYKDLVLKQSRVELLILLTGIMLVFLLLFILNHYINKLITAPLEIARRVVQLRLAGEEIETTQIIRTPYTEITRAINDTDRLYQKMRAPERKLITDATSKKEN